MSPRTQRLKVGWPGPALALWVLFRLPLAYLVGLGGGTLIGSQAQSLPGEERDQWIATALNTQSLVVLTLLSVVGLILSSLLLKNISRVARGTEGNGRYVTLALGGLSNGLGLLVVAGVFFADLMMQTPSGLATLAAPSNGLLNYLAQGDLPGLYAAAANKGLHWFLIAGLVIGSPGALGELGALLGLWFRLSERFRSRAWALVDLLLLAGFVAVTLLLPVTVPDTAPDAVLLPAIRLAVTTLAAIRFLARSLPLALDQIERLNFAIMVGARMLRARKSAFLSTIGALAILAVCVSCFALTTTLSVMGGFRNDLKNKILGNNAHLVVDQERGGFEGWAPVLERVRADPGVVAAAPYVGGDVMITSATNLAGAIIRGIDPETIGDVTDLPQNMRHGRLEYLMHPEQLLRLRPEEMNRDLLDGPLSPIETPPAVDSPDDGDSLDDEAAEEGTSIIEEIHAAMENQSAVINDAVMEDAVMEDAPSESGLAEASPETDDEAEARIRADISEYLLPETGLTPPGAADNTDLGEWDLAQLDAAAPPPGPSTETQDVLPGLIVGQELARTLRLHVGDEVNVVSPLGDLGPSGPIPRTRAFRIAGIFYSGMYEYDMKMAYTTLETAQRFLGLGDAISGIEAKVHDVDQAEATARSVEATIGRPNLRVRSWQEVNRNLFGALALEKLAMFIALGIAILVASFCIVGTLTLLVQEKGKEVGILKAMGVTTGQVVAIFMIQGLMIGVLGAASGLGLGYVGCFAMEHFGIRLNPEVYYIDKLPVTIDGLEFGLVGVASVVVCLLATIYPAIVGSRLKPVDALRFV